jgi:hypothetical protein
MQETHPSCRIFVGFYLLSAALTSVNLNSNLIGGVTSYIKKGEITGNSFKKGAVVTYKGSDKWVVFQEGVDLKMARAEEQCLGGWSSDEGETAISDGKLMKLQDVSGILALAAALPR